MPGPQPRHYHPFYPLHRREGSCPLDGAQRAPSASKAGPLMRLFALQGQTLFAPRFRSAQPWAHAHNPAPPRGVGDAAPYNTIRRASHYRKRPRRPGGRPPYIPLYHIPWGGAFARNSFTPPCRGRACPARSLAITTPFILCIVGRGLDPSAGRRGRRPLQNNPQGFSLPQTSAAAWGQAALHPTLPHSVGRGLRPQLIHATL